MKKIFCAPWQEYLVGVFFFNFYEEKSNFDRFFVVVNIA